MIHNQHLKAAPALREQAGEAELDQRISLAQGS
jgi:hypothetical protein